MRFGAIDYTTIPSGCLAGARPRATERDATEPRVLGKEVAELLGMVEHGGPSSSGGGFVDSPSLETIGKPMGKWEKHRKSMVKPLEYGDVIVW